MEQILRLKSTSMRSMNILKSLSGKTWGAGKTVMLRLYRSLIRSKLDYGCIIYATGKQTVLNLLDPVHNSAIRLCTGAFRSSPVVSLCAENGEMPLHIRRMQYWARIHQLPYSPICDTLRQSRLLLQSTGFLVQQYNQCLQLPDFTVSHMPNSDEPIWESKSSMFCSGFKSPPKRSINPENLRALFLEHMHTSHSGSKDGLSGISYNLWRSNDGP